MKISDKNGKKAFLIDQNEQKNADRTPIRQISRHVCYLQAINPYKIKVKRLIN